MDAEFGKVRVPVQALDGGAFVRDGPCGAHAVFAQQPGREVDRGVGSPIGIERDEAEVVGAHAHASGWAAARTGAAR